MFKIYFSNVKELFYFSRKMQKQNIQAEHAKDHHSKHSIEVSVRFGYEYTESIIASSLTETFIEYKLKDEIIHILKTKYFYEQDEEIRGIYELSHDLFTEPAEQTKTLRHRFEPPQLTLYNSFKQCLRRERSIYFDAIFKFCTQDFRTWLTDYIDIAIDEYKREEEHQTFLNTLRYYIGTTSPIVGTIHVLVRNPLEFYFANGKRLSKALLQEYLDQAPLYLVGLHERECNLSPLVSLLPDEIILYTNNRSSPLVVTILNVFEERAYILDESHFPFK